MQYQGPASACPRTIQDQRATSFSYVLFMYDAIAAQCLYLGPTMQVDGRQKVMFALTAIKGIGRRFSNIICKKCDIDLNKRAGELTTDEINKIVAVLQPDLLEQCFLLWVRLLAWIDDHWLEQVHRWVVIRYQQVPFKFPTEMADNFNHIRDGKCSKFYIMSAKSFEHVSRRKCYHLNY